MRTYRFPLPALLLLAGAALAGCSGSNRGGSTRAATPAPDATPRANALQHDYVASPQAHFDQMVVESRAQEAAAKAAADATAGKTRKAAPKARATAAAPRNGFPAPNSTAPTSTAPKSTPPYSPALVPNSPAPAPEPVARDACEPSPCIGGDPCIQREAAPPWCPPSADVALHSAPRAAR